MRIMLSNPDAPKGFHGTYVAPKSFLQTNSSGVMQGRFLVFPVINVEHVACIEHYYPGKNTPFQEFAEIKHVCVAGQSFSPKSEEWIEITWCASCKTKWDRGNCPRCAGTTVSPYGTPHRT